MVKHLVFTLVFMFSVSCFAASKSATVLFSTPERQGKEAFEKMSKMITDAKTSLKVVIYSYSNAKIRKAFKKLAKKNRQLIENGELPVDVKIVVHKDKKRSPKWCEEFESYGFPVKISQKTLHQKYIITDNKYLENGSGNLSSGAESTHHENFVFVRGHRALIDQFMDEFVLQWNLAKDCVPSESADVPSPELGFDVEENGFVLSEMKKDDPEDYKKYVQDVVTSLREYIAEKNAVTPDEIVEEFFASNSAVEAFFTSSNYTFKVVKPGKKNARLKPKIRKKAWITRDMIIKHLIGAAEETLEIDAAHFNLEDIAVAFIEAAKRGVKFRGSFDQREFSEYSDNKYTTLLKNMDIRFPVYSWFKGQITNQNHHKFILVDINDPVNAILMTGSYNFSKTSERSNWENTIVFRGKRYKKLYNDFLEEFEFLYSYARPDSVKDAMKTKRVKSILRDLTDDNCIAINFPKKKISLTFKEFSKLLKIGKKKAYKMFRQMNNMTMVAKRPAPRFFDIKKQRLVMKCYN